MRREHDERRRSIAASHRTLRLVEKGSLHIEIGG
jgi:hypothetical protein